VTDIEFHFLSFHTYVSAEHIAVNIMLNLRITVMKQIKTGYRL